MPSLPRVELQAEVDGRREAIFELVSTSAGLRRWLDSADVEATVGGAVHVRLADSVAVGKVLVVAPPQHVSFSWDWEGEPLGRPSVVAFDLIDHGRRTHLTLRHVGLAAGAQAQAHEDMWRYWFARLIEVAAGGAEPRGRMTLPGG